MAIAGLQNISSFSLLQSPITVDQLVKQAKQRNYQAIALTDINVTYGLVEFYKAAKNTGIKPLLGMQVRINGLIDESRKFDYVVLAKNQKGLENIFRLSSAINLLTENGENNKVLNLKELTKYLSDLVFIIPANDHSELKFLMDQNPNLASDFIRQLQDLIPQS